MFQCVPYSAALQPAWDELAEARGCVFHTTAFRAVLLESFDYECAYHAIMDESGGLRALLPLVVGRNIGFKRVGVALPFINYLDICADSDEARVAAVAALPQLKAQLNLAYLELRFLAQPFLAQPFVQPGWRAMRQHFTFVLPLAADEERVLALSTGSNRNHVRKVYKNGWFDVSFDAANLAAFYRVYCRRMHELGSPAPSLAFFKRFFQYLPNNAHLLTVLEKKTGDVVGGMLLVTSPANNTLYYPYGANLTAYNHQYLNSFMYWEAVRFGIRQGLQWLDLGRSQAGSGTYRYKAQWGAEPRQLTYLLYDGGQGSVSPADKEKLQALVELWKKTPRLLTDFVGPRLIKYVLP